MLVLAVLFAGSAAAAQVTAKSTPTPKPSAQSLPVWYQALVSNESLKVAVSIPGVGQFPALEVSGLPPKPKSGQATGKRQHMPMRLRVYYDTSTSPAAVKAALKVGRSFPSMKVRGATLKKVRVEYVQSVPKPQGAHVAISLGDGRTIEHVVEQISFVYEQIEWN